MSQNPNGGPNYNPYGPESGNPNYPPVPDTVYGGGNPQSSPGSNPGYNPYGSPPSGPNPYSDPSSNPSGTPNSSYGGSYSSPYAPPPPGIGSPPPASQPGANPYGPYNPTAGNQSFNSGATYPAYGQSSGGINPPTLPPAPQPMPPRQRNNGRTILISVIALVVIVGGAIFGVTAYNGSQSATQHANATATAQANVGTHATATAYAQATATAVSTTYPFSANQILNDPLVDNSKNIRWDSDQSSGCFFSGSAYHVVQATSGHYNTCAALSSDYANFTFEAEMVIKSGGSTGAGGLIFRADENGSKYYRLSIDTTGSYFILAIVDSTGTNGNARKLKDGTASTFSTGVGSTNTLAIVARGDQYSFYVNRQLVTSFTDGTYSHGQIGFDVDYGDSSTELLFTNAKVWQL